MWRHKYLSKKTVRKNDALIGAGISFFDLFIVGS